MEWITDRLPTEKDADEDGDVMVQSRPRASTTYFHWSMVKPGMAWAHTDLWEAQNEPAPTTPRRFVSISRTVWADQDSSTIDAIADDGTAWWMVPGQTGWHQLPPLPDREAS